MKPKAAEPQLLVVSYQLSALEVILKFEDLEVWERSSRCYGYAFTDN